MEQDAIYAFMEKEWLVNISKIIEEHPELNYPGFNLDDFAKFADYFKDGNGDIYGLPFEA